MYNKFVSQFHTSGRWCEKHLKREVGKNHADPPLYVGASWMMPLYRFVWEGPVMRWWWARRPVYSIRMPEPTGNRGVYVTIFPFPIFWEWFFVFFANWSIQDSEGGTWHEKTSRIQMVVHNRNPFTPFFGWMQRQWRKQAHKRRNERRNDGTERRFGEFSFTIDRQHRTYGDDR